MQNLPAPIGQQMINSLADIIEEELTKEEEAK